MSDLGKVCEHGQLARVCLTCEQAAEIERLTAECDAWRKMVLDHNEAMRQYENNYHRIDIPPELEPKP